MFIPAVIEQTGWESWTEGCRSCMLMRRVATPSQTFPRLMASAYSVGVYEVFHHISVLFLLLFIYLEFA